MTSLLQLSSSCSSCLFPQPSVRRLEIRSVQQSRLLTFRENHSWARRNAALVSPRVHTLVLRASADEEIPGLPAIFPRISVHDPYKRLGISREASEEEIHEARNYLIKTYGGHEKSKASIEAAYDKIIMQSLRARRRPKFDLQSKLKQKYSQLPSWIRNISNIYDVPSPKDILIRAVFFALLGVWSVLIPMQNGPAIQVALSLAGCIYFLYGRNKVVWKVWLFGFGSFLIGWILASISVAYLPALYPRSWSIELVSALMTYLFLWFSCTFLSNAVRA